MEIPETEEELYWGVTTKKVPQDSPPKLEDKSKVKSCPKCNVMFGLMSSKYNCSACGKVFCKMDCDRWLLLPDSFKFETIDPVRVCQTCYEKYNLVDFSRDYDEFGPKDAPSAIILPGALCPRIIPPSVKDGLKGYHVISADLPGYGARQHETLTNESALESIKDAILKHAKDKKALVLGFSMGGHLAMKFGQKYPELCTGLVFGLCCNEYYGLKADIFFKSTNLVYKSCTNSFNSKLLLRFTPKECHQATKWILAEGMQYHLWGPCGSLMAEPHEHFYRQALSSMTMPVMFLHGSKDFRTGETAFMEANKNAEFAIIDEADHSLLLNPKYHDIVAQKIQEFADKVTKKKEITE